MRCRLFFLRMRALRLVPDQSSDSALTLYFQWLQCRSAILCRRPSRIASGCLAVVALVFVAGLGRDLAGPDRRARASLRPLRQEAGLPVFPVVRARDCPRLHTADNISCLEKPKAMNEGYAMPPSNDRRQHQRQHDDH